MAISLVFAAALIMKFSKGAGLFTPTYMIHIQANNVGGIISGATVNMAGVPIGSIEEIELSRDGGTVTMHAKILEKFKIASNAVFSIRQAGFLGDRFIAVTPGPPPKAGQDVGVLEDGATVVSLEPFDLAEVAESASGLMDQLTETTKKLNHAVARLDTTVMSDHSLSNLTDTIGNFRALSERAMQAVASIDSFVTTNTVSMSGSISNFGLFTEKLNAVTLELQETLATNRVEITSVIKNMESATLRIDNLLEGIDQGEGLAGRLLKNPELANNTTLILSNLMVLSSNINNKGLWGVIRKPKKED